MNLRWKIAQAAEIRWWQRYLKPQSKEAYLDWKQNYWQQLLVDMEVVVSKNAEILDIGCGPAGIFIALPQARLDAVDPLLDQYESKLPHFQKAWYPYTTFFSQPFEHFSEQKKYDQIFCLNAINHVADLSACLDKLMTALKPTGELIFSIDAHNFSFLKYLFRLLPGDILHPHQYDLAEYRKMLTDRNGVILKTLRYRKELIFDYYLLKVQVRPKD